MIGRELEAHSSLHTTDLVVGPYPACWLAALWAADVRLDRGKDATAAGEYVHTAS